MRTSTFASIVILGVSGAAIAQVSTSPRRTHRVHNSSNTMMANTMMMNNMAMPDDMPMNGSNTMSNGNDMADPMPGNTVGTPTEPK